MTPEQKARKNIDRQLEQCGWLIQDFAEMNISAGLGVAVREFPLKNGFADYLLYVNGKAIGVIEAKPEGHTLVGVETQSAKYTDGLPEGLPNYRLPLPFAYESTGIVTQFTNGLDPEPRSREVFTFHRPEELLRLVRLDSQLRANLRKMPPLNTTRLWPAQVEAITNLEKSLADNRPRALIQMATGSGKTYTACSFCYRLIKFAKAKRILFLVDRNNLGKQTFTEFQQYISPYTNYKFTEEFNVQHLRGNIIDPASKVVITTIQRLYSILKGEEEFDEEREEQSMFETGSPLIKEPLPVVYNPKIPIETFDFIVVDECHRSIYNLWRQVLEYFDAFIIGLTATPTAQTVGFFNGNVVQNYSHERAVADGVNVGYEVYRIRTQITEKGATLVHEPGRFVPHRDRRTHKKRLAELDDDLTYTANQLDRDVVNLSQIRLVIRTFKDRLFTDIFPGRTEVPKTLVFAKNDLHAEDIVRIIREEFGKGNDFCQKITYKTTGKKPEELLNEFRNSYNPRIAVTVDMIATGTDVKPLECLLFMRNVNSASYFEQMKGRGSRVISPDDLKRVTPDAKYKTHFVIVDAVGVCENDKTLSKPLDRKPSVSLEKILQLVAQGMVHPDIVSTLAARLARLQRELTPKEAEEIAAAAGGKGLNSLISGLLESLDPDINAQKAREKFRLSEEQEPTEEQLDEIEQESMAEALRPFHNPKLRETIIKIKSSLEQVIDEITQDELVEAGFDAAAKEKARSVLENFHRFLEENKDEIEAIQLLYSRPYRAGLRYRHVKELATAIERNLGIRRPEQQLWRLYEAVEPEKVKGKGGKALVDLIAIVRHALYPDQPLIPIAQTVEERYQQWLAEQEASGIVFTPEQRKWLDAIKDHIATSLSIDQEDFEEVPFNQMGGLGRVYQLFGDRLPEIIQELNERLAA
ncbi:type I restriction endonuclease subunit R [Desulfofundulus thermocisternus]|uniref:type I restriction endonuclease subunit R n=1 Tax=Desulfofundulus thermocisternus TaxID=42471 RepID=UPI00217CE184|nr:type I restriction-modification enzyme R subunit C-terminal domain-containing protein [Desulfofundulus thermocisternus]MCS5696954.1 DEAD/DEAH box helicase family protein [Desulfofundulus thermocisternus]